MPQNDPTKLAVGVGIAVAVVWLLNAKRGPEDGAGDWALRIGAAAIVGGLVGAALYFMLQ